MKVILAKTAGFCMGVRRAMNAVIDATHRSHEKTYTLGPLVHNNQAMEMLKARSVEVVEHPSEVSSGTLFIRAHGVTPQVRCECELPGVTVHDMTCPHVRRAQNIVREHAEKGFDAIIVGDKNHAEVIGLLGHAGGRGHVLSSPEEVQDLPALERVCLVAQTTQSSKRFQGIVDAVRQRFPGVEIHNTICSATDDRQNEVRALTRQVEAMVVVGGQHSGNTVRLAEIARAEGIPTFHIETDSELTPEMLRGFDTIGVTAGASTPHWVFQAVVEKIESFSQSRSTLGRFLVQPLRIGIHTYLYLGAGSAAMTYAALRFLEIRQRLSYLLLSFLYVTSMHVLNRFTDRAAAEINDPLRMSLFRRIAKPLFWTAVAFGAAALVLAATFGTLPAILMGASLAAGVGYNLRIVPGKLSHALRFSKVKEIPGSKDLSPAAAWATVAVLLPCLAERSAISFSVLLAFAFVFLLVFNRSLVYDLRDTEGDRLVGNETLPLILGKQRTGWLLLASFGALFALIVLDIFIGPRTLHLLALAISVVYAGLCALLHYRKVFISRKLRFELAVDAQFIIMGFLSWWLTA
ncbi:MAG: 4-hydroxy-3-methylbut-2-enyl diphosphate reductase [Planctomycetota bacterium]